MKKSEWSDETEKKNKQCPHNLLSSRRLHHAGHADARDSGRGWQARPYGRMTCGLRMLQAPCGSGVMNSQSIKQVRFENVLDAKTLIKVDDFHYVIFVPKHYNSAKPRLFTLFLCGVAADMIWIIQILLGKMAICHNGIISACICPFMQER